MQGPSSASQGNEVNVIPAPQQEETWAGGSPPRLRAVLPARTGSLKPHGQDPGQFRFSHDTSLGSNLAVGVAAGFPT